MTTKNDCLDGMETASVLLTPITVPTGVKPSPQKGNLTGIPRRIRDNCADLYNLIQQWKTLSAKGLEIIQNIATTKVQDTSGQDDVQEKSSFHTPNQELVQQCDSLLVVYQTMVGLTQKMTLIQEQFQHIEALHTMQSSSFTASTSSNKIIFLTWTAMKFREMAASTSSMFLEEIKVKHSVVESVAHVSDANDLLFLSALWVHEPMLKPELALSIEAMLVETGLR